MKQLTLAAFLPCLLVFSLNAQQALWGGTDILSPEIRKDNSVVFRLQAPHAGEVRLAGDWMPGQGWMPGSVLMKKENDTVWTYTAETLPSDLYSYYYLVDGMRCTDQNNVHQVRDVASVSNIMIVGGDRGDLYRVNAVPHGTVARYWYDSPGNNAVRRITVYTPPGYETSGESYPVLYLLHGMGGDEEAWITLGRTAQIMDNLIARGKARPMIVVMPNGNVSQEAAPGESSLGLVKPAMMLPNTMNGRMEETFMDVVRFVEGRFRIRADKANRAIAGLSMGGFHSLHISRIYPDTFDYIGLFSAAVKPFGEETSKVYDNLETTLKKQMENGIRLYWIGMGKTDFLYKTGEEYRALLDGIGLNYTYVESEGGHTWSNWRCYLSEFVPLLFQ